LRGSSEGATRPLIRVERRRPARGRAARQTRPAILAALVAAALWAAPGEAAAFGLRALFDAEAARSDNIGLFPKWTGALARHAAERMFMSAPCVASALDSCQVKSWTAFLASLRPRDARAQLEGINRYMNRRRYVVDPRNYGVPDYWATPVEFLYRDGDCEDYAIAKYLSLRELGFAADRLRIVVLDDLNLGVVHAVLAVRHDDEILILDNQIDSVVPAAVIHHYRPIYSVNERHWWLHRPPVESARAPGAR
jgi:predicted transglutaminase-like cysteine proteinase